MIFQFTRIIYLSYLIFKLIKSEDISISPYLNAFKIYQKQTYFHRVSYSYINPAIHNFNVTTKLDEDIKRQPFSKSDMTVTVHTDRSQYYDLEKTDSYTINTICKFDYSPDVLYHYRNICCRITIQDFNFTRNDFYSIKFCKLTLDRYSSACFLDLLFQKSFIPKTNRADHFNFGLRAFVFSTDNDDCNSHSTITKILAVSKLYPLSFSNGLSVFWTNLFSSNLSTSLELGRPFHSLDPDSFVSFPVKLITERKLSHLKIKCFISDNLEIKSVFFDENIFEAEYQISAIENQFVVTIMLQNKGSSYQKSSQWWVDRGLLLFIMYGRITDASAHSQQNLFGNGWIKCQIENVKKFGHNKIIPISTKETKQVQIAINTGKFIIIPIFKTKHYFSIFNDIDKPIGLDNDFITLYSIHDVQDGSFVEVTKTATCDPIDRKSVICPQSMIKSTDKYFHTALNQLDTEQVRIIPFKYDLILQMKTWKSVIFSPINLWFAQDWQLDISDKIINKVKGWRIPIRSSITKELICVMMFQRSRMKVMARLANRNSLSEKEFYGSSYHNEAPLLDITSQMQKETIEFSPPNSGISYDEKLSDFIVNPQSGFNSIDVRLLSLNNKRLLAIERVKISLEQVEVQTVKAYCLSSIDIFQEKRDRLSNYRLLNIEYTLQNDTKKNCYLFIIIVFSDFTEIRLDEIPNNYYRVFVSQLDFSNQKYISTPIESTKYISYSHQMNITIYESDICRYSKAVFSGLVKVNIQKDFDTTKITTQHLSSTPVSVVNQVTTNINEMQNRELLMNLSSLYYGLYALIALVSLVAFIVLINCLVKFNYRKVSNQSSTVINQSANNKLLNSVQSAPVDEAPSPTFSKHPPLLPPPGPLRNASDSEVELASSTFWSNCSSQDSASFTNRKYSSSLLEHPIPMTPLNNFLIRTSPLVSSVYANTKYRNNPSPSSDQGDGGYLSGENPSKFSQLPLLKKSSDDRNINLDTLERSNESGGLTLFPEAYPVPPPCPPLKWSIQWASSMVSALPVFSQSYTPNLITDSTCVVSRVAPCSELGTSVSQWVTNKSIPSSSSVPYTKSIDNLCEKSSGLGSLTSTQQEDYSILSDDDNYHVSINSDKEHYRKYLKKC